MENTTNITPLNNEIISAKQGVNKKLLLATAVAVLSAAILLTTVGFVVLGTRSTLNSSSSFSTISNVKNSSAVLSGIVGNAPFIDTAQQKLNILDILPIGRTINTDNTSRASIEFSDGSIVRMDANTTLIITKLDEGNILLSLIKGYIYNSVTPNRSRLFAVTSGGVIMKALGTIFTVKNDAVNVELDVINSKVEVNNETDSTEVLNGEKIVVGIQSDLSSTSAHNSLDDNNSSISDPSRSSSKHSNELERKKEKRNSSDDNEFIKWSEGEDIRDSSSRSRTSEVESSDSRNSASFSKDLGSDNSESEGSETSRSRSSTSRTSISKISGSHTSESEN